MNSLDAIEKKDLFMVLPLKLTSRQGYQDALKTWLNNNNAATSPFKQKHKNFSTLRLDIVRLESLRHCLVESMGTESRYNHTLALRDHALEDCREYHATLLAFEQAGFPSSEEEVQSYKSLYDIDFTYKAALLASDNNDTNHEEGPETHSSMRWERLCTLYNAVALESYLVIHEGSNKDKAGWTQSMRRLQSAYATLDYLKQLVSTTIQNNNGNGYLTLDLHPSTMEFIEALLKAQGQVCGLHMALHGNTTTTSTSFSMLAKLAIGVSESYKKALTAIQQDSLLRKRFPQYYSTHCKTQTMYFKMLGEYYECQALRVQSKWGHEIGRLQSLVPICKATLSFLQSIPSTQAPSMLKNATYIQTLVLQRLNTIVHENNTIYHEDIVTNNTDVPPVFLIKTVPKLDSTITTPKKALPSLK